MTRTSRLGLFWTLGLGIILLSPGRVLAQEHPEHPETKAENPEHPEAEVTMDALGDAIEGWIAEQTQLMGGYFMVWDPVDKTPLALTLDKVHRERLSKLSDEVLFACADFKTIEGKVYDLDMFMSPGGDHHFMATEVKVHKKEGKPRYTWHEDGGVWKSKPVK